MGRANSLSEAISVAGERARYDAEAKKLIAEPQILSRILAECVSEYRGMTPKEIEERYLGRAYNDAMAEALHRDVMRPAEDASITEGTIHYDLLFHLDSAFSDECLRIYVNVEAQNTFSLAMYYGCRLVSAQYGKTFSHSEYGRIERVYSIWICPSVPGMLKNTIHRFRMQAEGKADDAILKYYNGVNLVEIVFVNTGNRCGVGDITALLWTLLHADMDAEGREENMIASVSSLMKKGNVPVEKAMELLSIPEADRPGLLSRLK